MSDVSTILEQRLIDLYQTLTRASSRAPRFNAVFFPPTNMDARRFCSADKLPILISYDLKMLDGQRKHFLFFLEDFTVYIKTVFCHGKKKTVNANRHCIKTSELM